MGPEAPNSSSCMFVKARHEGSANKSVVKEPLSLALSDSFLLFRPQDTGGFCILRDIQRFQEDEAHGSPKSGWSLWVKSGVWSSNIYCVTNRSRGLPLSKPVCLLGAKRVMIITALCRQMGGLLGDWGLQLSLYRTLFFVFYFFFNVYLLLRDRETRSMSRGGAERWRDTESEAGSRL